MPPRRMFIRLSEVQAKPVEWLWKDRIPLGEITILDGDPGTNKSSVAVDLAARVSRGREMPDGTEGQQGGVIFLLGEDSVAKTLLRRASAAEADLTNLAVLDGDIAIPRDVARIQEAARGLRAKLIVVDPLTIFLERNVCADQSVRKALRPLAALADRTNAAIVGIRHLTKSTSRRSLYRGMGSIGIVAAARAAMLIGKAPDDPDMRVLCSTKNNLGQEAASLLFEPIPTDDGAVRLEWRGQCNFTPEDILAAPTNGDSRVDEAKYFLLEFLDGDPMEQTLLRVKAAERGIAYRTLQRAKDQLGVVSRREGWGPGSKCYWSLPAIDPTEADSLDDDGAPLNVNSANWRSMDGMERGDQSRHRAPSSRWRSVRLANIVPEEPLAVAEKALPEEAVAEQKNLSGAVQWEEV